jgi:hypothetical protein
MAKWLMIKRDAPPPTPGDMLRAITRFSLRHVPRQPTLRVSEAAELAGAAPATQQRPFKSATAPPLALAGTTAALGEPGAPPSDEEDKALSGAEGGASGSGKDTPPPMDDSEDEHPAGGSDVAAAAGGDGLKVKPQRPVWLQRLKAGYDYFML